MDDRDLQLLRAFRSDEAEPPEGLQARIEERLWQAILAEESARSTRDRRRSAPWWARLTRPIVAAGAVGALALGVAVASDGGAGSSGIGQGSVQQAGAGILDSTASRLFGGATASTNATQIQGRLDLRSGDARVFDGPAHEGDELDEASAELARNMTRDPDELLETVRQSVVEEGITDSGDSVAFHVAMHWVVDPAVPVDLRAAMLRSIEDVDGIDEALAGTDALGRTGVVIGQLDRASGVRSQYVLDPADGSLLEVRAFTTAYLDPGCPPGTVTLHEAYDQDGRPVDRTAAQWVDWPQVVEACAPTFLVSS